MSEPIAPATSGANRRRAANAVFDQFVVAGTSFVLMILVRRQLGREAFGKYGLLINAMILLTALQTAWIGDSLTVLDRFDRRVRSGLVASALAFAGSTTILAFALSFRVIPPATAALFAAMVMLWGVEEIGRRLFMARMTFRALLINDALYAVGAFVALGAFWMARDEITLAAVIGAMLVGAITSIIAAAYQLPANEWAWQRPSLRAARDLAPFAGWRSAQLAIRPLAQYAIRNLVVVLASYEAVGDLESARLFSQPAMTYVSGVASLLLPMYAHQERVRKRGLSLPVMTTLLVLPVAVYGAVIVALRNPIAAKVFDDRGAVSGTAVIGWLAIALMFAAGQPVANLLVARRQSREVFMVRAADSAIGLALAVLFIHFASPSAAPWALACGMVVGTFWLLLIARRGAPETLLAPASASASASASDGTTLLPSYRDEVSR